MANTNNDHFDYDVDNRFHPESNQVINLAMGLKYPIDIEPLKLAFSNTIMLKNPRFSSVIIRDKNGLKHWKKATVNLNDHIIIHHHTSPTTTTSLEDYKEAAVNDFLTNVPSETPTLDENKPLWKLHLLMDLNCVVLSVHHEIGDEFSLMSLLSGCFSRATDNNRFKQTGYVESNLEKKLSRKRGVWELIQSIWLSFVYIARFIGRVFWVKDRFTVIDERNKGKFSRSKLATAQYKLEDFWFIKTAIPYTTINDVLLGVISCGLSKYLDLESPNDRLKDRQRNLTAILKVNLRKDPTVLQKLEDMIETSSGSSKREVRRDQTSTVLLPVYVGKRLHPLEHVTVMKATMNSKKMSFEAFIIHISLNIISSFLGPKVASWFYNRALSNSTLLISTIKGPSHEIAIADNPVTYIRGNISNKSHAAIEINTVSYAGRVDIQVMVAKDAISNPNLLIKCFHESLLEMKSYSKLIHLLLSTGNPTQHSSDWFLHL